LLLGGAISARFSPAIYSCERISAI